MDNDDYDMDDPIELDIAEQSVIELERVIATAITQRLGDGFGEYDMRVAVCALMCIIGDIAQQGDLPHGELHRLLDISLED